VQIFFQRAFSTIGVSINYLGFQLYCKKAIPMKFINHASCAMGIALFMASCSIFVNKRSQTSSPPKEEPAKPIFASAPVYVSPLASRAGQARSYARENNFSMSYCFFVDMSIHSGRNRFFVYDLERNMVVMSGLVAHGNCKQGFLTEAKFSNIPGCGCSSIGKYRIGEKYTGQYGKSYKLYGLESTNSNAYKRAIVLHGTTCIPDREIYPQAVCNSFGCAMVSQRFFEHLATFIDRSKRPIVLWIYN
jgi:L,D-transpeptidase catalytic domain